MVPGPVDLEAATRADESVTQVQVMARQEGQVVATLLGSLGHGGVHIRVPGPGAAGGAAGLLQVALHGGPVAHLSALSTCASPAAI